jgi:signal transduction histidine kinase
MQRRFLQRVAANVTRLSNMIEDLIRMAALDSGNFTLEREHVDLVGIVEDAISEVSVPLREKGIEVNLDLAVDEAMVSVDREAMKQVVLQLLTNAYLAAPESSVVEITIDLERQAGRRWVHLAVTDAGAGIAPEDLPRVFGRRYQSENPLLAGLGDTGIGLAIAKQIVEAHDGTIDVESSVGGPTRFNVRLEFMPQARN